jgi:hypothetical protein
LVTYTINGPILEITLEGSYTTQEIADVVIAAKADPALPLPLFLLSDFRESLLTPSFTDMGARFRLIQDLAPTRVAMVVSGVARERLARIYQTRATDSGLQIEVFSDLQAARDWLH